MTNQYDYKFTVLMTKLLALQLATTLVFGLVGERAELYHCLLVAHHDVDNGRRQSTLL